MSASRIEGESDEGFIKANPDLHAFPRNSQPNPSTKSLPTQPTVSKNQAPPNLDTNPENPSSDPIERPKRIRKPTQKVRDILDNVAVPSSSQARLPTGIQLPTQIPQANEHLPAGETNAALEGEGLSDWMMFEDEYALAAEMSETEALEPRNLAEAKSRPDWSLWEKSIHEEL